MLSAASVPSARLEVLHGATVTETRTLAFYRFAVLADKPAQVDARQRISRFPLATLGQVDARRRQPQLHSHRRPTDFRQPTAGQVPGKSAD
ncbi:MAG: hypothetical protein WD049_08145 [Candidatus Paceibacterota bacterium]